MPEKIGKYVVRERIGRGGMGMIFKAHDPVLDRPVALKVISPEVEVTDELRARFFREAQACARLSHPNIVTIYDMGEDDGRLFIVMELLEGVELRQLIAQRKTPALEDKLSVMEQVCDGLHYAHRKGIVHRDIKPANIFLQHNGVAKILDFGIAQVANTEGGLTRTGLIMGTLRYISPEQVRGQADHRSDIYSAGAVFYEFLCLRPPLASDDPMQLLEQLRTEDPPPVDQVDPSIPAELAAIIGKALRKNPAERFGDFEQMQSALEGVRHRLLDEARQIGARVRDLHRQLLELRTALTERVGSARDDETITTVDERGRLGALQALERDLSARIKVLQAQIRQADTLEPAFRHATLLLEAGRFAEAAQELEAIVTDMPDFARARDRLAEARAQVEARRREELAGQLLQDARATLTAGDYTLSLQILAQAAEIPPPAEAVQELASLRETAEAAVAQRTRQHAETARAEMAEAQQAAETHAETPYATTTLWREAEALRVQAETALARGAYADAASTFAAASNAYRRFVESARAAERQAVFAAEQAREQMARGRQRGDAAAAPQYAREIWDAALAKSAEAETAFANHALAQAASAFTEAEALYGRAEEAAREARQRERRLAEEVRAEVSQARERARNAEVPRDAQDAVDVQVKQGEEAFAQGAYTRAREILAEAAAAYRRLEEAAREARSVKRRRAAEAQQRATEGQRNAAAAQAERYAGSTWSAATEKSAAAEAALAREQFAPAAETFTEALALYEQAEGEAREARQRQRAAAEHARQTMAEVRDAAMAADAATHAAADWRDAEATVQSGEGAFGREAYAEAREVFDRAAGLHRQAEERAREVVRALETARAAAERGRESAAGARRAAAETQGPQYAGAEWQAAENAEARAGSALTRGEYAQARDLFTEARRQYAAAARTASIALEAQARRADAMVSDARQLLASGDISGCLRRLNDVLTLRPDHAGAQQLRVEAERAREASDLTRLSAAEAPTLLTVTPTVTADAPAMTRAPAATRARSPSGSATAATSVWRRTGRPTWARRGMVVVLGALAVIAVAYWGYWLPSRVVWPPPSILDLQKQAVAAREEAVRAGAERSAPFAIAADRQRAADAAFGRRDAATADQRYRDAITSYGLARTAVEQGRATAMTAAGLAADARKKAESAEAPRRAVSSWAKAGSAQRDAASALERQDFDRARTLFGEAEKTYQEAEQVAISELTKEVHAEAKQAKALASAARGDAERADGRRLAAKSFALGQQKEGEADALLDADPASARRALQESIELYKQAVQDAAAQHVRLQRDASTQARSGMMEARRVAEREAASQRAPVLFDWGQRKERAASTAVDRQDYTLAEQLYGDAQADYESAAREAQRTRDRNVSAQSSAEQARRRVAAYRQRAIKAEADRLAGDLFAIAQAKEAGADELMNRQSYALATDAYGEVGDRYLAAARRAIDRREADGARADMLVEKQRAIQKATDYQEALAEEKQGVATYERLHYREAAQRFRTAQALYGRTATKTAAPATSPRPR
ncbi:MAG TPA: protein kinase [Candidatus Methylomirabilis sp.]|nr:protein kinase [Candidatus Methylomirabilis sp.]